MSVDAATQDTLRLCTIKRSSYQRRNIWRVSVGTVDELDAMAKPRIPITPQSHTEQFCVHGHTSATVAGTMCNDCGIVLNHVHAMVDLAHSRPPVCDTSSVGDAMLLEVGIDGTCTVDAAACLQEWRRHINVIQNQPNEVVHNAYRIFRLVYEQQGPISGSKARAIMLVSLLYSNRLLYGNNKANEEYLLRTFGVPTRMMNRAFGSLAAVTLLQKGPTASVTSIGQIFFCDAQC
jgi:hypothetical protein